MTNSNNMWALPVSYKRVKERIRIYLFFSIALFSQHVLAVFSQFVIVTPDTQHKYLDSLSVEKTEDGSFLIRLSEPRWPKHIWLITSRSELQDDQKEFRSYIWKNDIGERNIEVFAKLGVGALPPSGTSDTSLEESGIEVILSENVMSRSYIYIDYPRPVFDGGYYFAIDLPEYLRNVEAKKL